MSRSKQKNREFVYKALVDPNFRAQLERDPAKALQVRALTPKTRTEVKNVLDTIKRIEAQINGLVDELLCANGGPCGIA